MLKNYETTLVQPARLRRFPRYCSALALKKITPLFAKHAVHGQPAQGKPDQLYVIYCWLACVVFRVSYCMSMPQITSMLTFELRRLIQTYTTGSKRKLSSRSGAPSRKLGPNVMSLADMCSMIIATGVLQCAVRVTARDALPCLHTLRNPCWSACANVKYSSVLCLDCREDTDCLSLSEEVGTRNTNDTKSFGVKSAEITNKC